MIWRSKASTDPAIFGHSGSSVVKTLENIPSSDVEEGDHDDAVNLNTERCDIVYVAFGEGETCGVRAVK